MKNKIVLCGACLLLLLTVLLLGCSGSDSEGGSESESNGFSASNLEDGEVIKIPLDQVTSKVAKFEHNADGIVVKYFVLLGSDREVRTAFDACDVCGGYKGYVQQGGDIACKNCGRVFSIDGLGTKNKGYGCWPSYLSHTIKNGKVFIEPDEIEKGAFRFA